MEIMVKLNDEAIEMLNDFKRWNKINSKIYGLDLEVADSVHLLVAFEGYYDSYKVVGSLLDDWEEMQGMLKNKN